MKVNIRCCCTPMKVFGHLNLPDWVERRQQIIHVPLYRSRPLRVVDGLVAIEDVDPHVKIQLKWIYHNARGMRELAVYSEDRPESFWPGVYGFSPGRVLEDIVEEKA